MRTAFTILYLLTMVTAVSPVKIFEPPTENGTLLFVGLWLAWLLALPWSLATFVVIWWFMHDYSSPLFLVFFLFSGSLNAILFNIQQIRDRFERWKFYRRNSSV